MIDVLLKAAVALFALAFLALLAFIPYALWYNHRHPCVRWGEPQTCSTMVCTVYTTIGDIHTCSMYQTQTYDCTRCLERQP